MPDDPTPTDPTTDPASATDPAPSDPPADPAPVDPEPTDPPADPQPEPEPETFSKEYVQGLRQEAANYRTQLRDAQTKLEGAKTPEEFEAAVSDLRTANAALERQVLVTDVARKHDLPDELAELLQGDDEAALTEHAKKLARFIPASSSADELNGGLTPSDDDDVFDPVAVAKAARARRY